MSPVFPVCAVTTLFLFFLCALGPSWVDEDGGGDLTSPLSCREGTSCPSHLCLSALIPPIPSHSVSGPGSQSAANSCQHVIQQKLRVFVGSPESVKGPIKCTQQLSWSDRLKTRSPENRQDTQLLGVCLSRCLWEVTGYHIWSAQP